MPKEHADDDHVIPTVRMTMEEQQIGRDLVDHAMDKIKTVVRDMVELHDHPAHLYMLNFAGMEFFMHGMAMFDLSTISKANRAQVNKRNAMDRIIRASAMGMMIVLAQRGSKECKQLLKRSNHLSDMDGREMLRFLSQMATYETAD
jgi:hypothetical protein